jgi:uncharacterized protein (DUF486 family)
MTLAWYGHLKFKSLSRLESLGLISIVFISWGIALFEYFFQVPANRIGYAGNGGPFSLVQLKVIQEVISISVFIVFTLVAFRNETLRVNTSLPSHSLFSLYILYLKGKHLHIQ